MSDVQLQSSLPCSCPHVEPGCKGHNCCFLNSFIPDFSISFTSDQGFFGGGGGGKDSPLLNGALSHTIQLPPQTFCVSPPPVIFSINPASDC